MDAQYHCDGVGAGLGCCFCRLLGGLVAEGVDALGCCLCGALLRCVLRCSMLVAGRFRFMVFDIVFRMYGGVNETTIKPHVAPPLQLYFLLENATLRNVSRI